MELGKRRIDRVPFELAFRKRRDETLILRRRQRYFGPLYFPTFVLAASPAGSAFFFFFFLLLLLLGSTLGKWVVDPCRRQRSIINLIFEISRMFHALWGPSVSTDDINSSDNVPGSILLRWLKEEGEKGGRKKIAFYSWPCKKKARFWKHSTGNHSNVREYICIFSNIRKI